MKRFVAIFLLVPLLSITSACTFSTDQGATADRIVKECHKALEQKDWNKLFSLYNERFFKQMPKDAWKARLTEIFNRLGPLKSETAEYQKADSVARGDYYMYGFTLHFAKGAAKETITVMRGVNEKKLSIAGHIIRPIALSTPSQ